MVADASADMISNDTVSAQVANLRATPRYRITSEVLDDPALINPTTGAPFAGSFEVALTSFNKTKVVEPGYFESETLTGARMCIGGLVSKAALVDQYGLTEAQAMSLAVNGFINDLARQFPMEYSVELKRLIDLEMEGSVG